MSRDVGILDAFETVIRELGRHVVHMDDDEITRLSIIIMQSQKYPMQFLPDLVTRFRAERARRVVQIANATRTPSLKPIAAPPPHARPSGNKKHAPPELALPSGKKVLRTNTPSPDSTMAPLALFAPSPSATPPVPPVPPVASVEPEVSAPAPPPPLEPFGAHELEDLFAQCLDPEPESRVRPEAVAEVSEAVSLLSDHDKRVIGWEELADAVEGMSDQAVASMFLLESTSAA